MAAGNTTDTRTHVMGDMLMLTGTFTDGGTSVPFGDLLSTVFAAGGHLTSLVNTGILINNGAGYAAGEAGPMTVDTVAARAHLYGGQDIYSAAGVRLGQVNIVNDTTIIAADTLQQAVIDDQPLHVLGAHKPSITLVSTSIDVSIDETNQRVVFSVGKTAAAGTTETGDGRWWIMGQR